MFICRTIKCVPKSAIIHMKHVPAHPSIYIHPVPITLDTSVNLYNYEYAYAYLCIHVGVLLCCACRDVKHWLDVDKIIRYELLVIVTFYIKKLFMCE